MGGRLASWRLLVGSTGVVVLAGCAAGASPKPKTVGPVTVVTGTHQCPGVNWKWTTDSDGTLHLRDLPIECIDTTNDPRVSGTHTASANMDVWGTLANGAGVQWASVRLEDAGGAWEAGNSVSPPCPDAGTSWSSGTREPAATRGWPTSS
jgi:hypothetical protein